MKVKVISLPYIFQVLYVLCFSRPIYQVSVHRTIGPLVLVYPCSGVLRCYRCRYRRCRSPFSNIFSSETACPIKKKFHVEPPWKGITKVYINGPDHMTKMVAMPIYGKTFKIFFSRTGSPMILKLGMKHRGLKFYKVYINGDPVLTLT